MTIGIKATNNNFFLNSSGSMKKEIRKKLTKKQEKSFLTVAYDNLNNKLQSYFEKYLQKFIATKPNKNINSKQIILTTYREIINN